MHTIFALYTHTHLANTTWLCNHLLYYSIYFICAFHSLTVPEVQLPNFFMPPQELEQAMRSLRASALSRPPPPGLFGSTPTYPQEVRDDTQDVAHRALSTQSSVRTLQDVDQFLRSRRHTSTAGGVSSDHNRCHTVSDKDTPLSILYCKANN